MANRDPDVPRVVVSGFAALDHAMGVGELPGPNRGTLVTRRLSEPFPRQGGSAPQIAGHLSLSGVPVDLLTRLGNDEAGMRYLNDLRSRGVGVSAVEVTPGRSAAAWLFYDPLGRSLFFLDPGGAESTELNPAQRLALSRAGWLCITAGPPLVSERVLDASAAAIAWCVKADPVVFPPPLSRRLLRTAALIVHNRSEEDFLQDAASPDPLDELVSPESLIIATDGAGRIRFAHRDVMGFVDVPPISPIDVTGAGDAFLAGVLKSLVTGAADPPTAVLGGISAAHSLLSRPGNIL